MHKSGWTWRHGEAVHLILWQHRVNTGLAFWLAHHEPLWFSPIATRLTMRLELALPVLLLFPAYRQFTRGAAFIGGLGLHLGIALLMTLGPFSYAMIALLLLCLPGESLDLVGARLSRKRRLQLARVHRRLVLQLAPYVRIQQHPRRSAARLRSTCTLLREGSIFLLLISAAIEATHNPGVSTRYRFEQPKVLAAFVTYPRMEQYWSMFAPDAPTDDGTLVVDALTESGAHVDPFTGLLPDFEMARRGLTPHSAILEDYLFAMSRDGNRRYDGELKRFVRNWHPPDGRAAGDRIVGFSAWWVNHQSPVRGQVTPGPVERRLLLHANW